MYQPIHPRIVTNIKKIFTQGLNGRKNALWVPSQEKPLLFLLFANASHFQTENVELVVLENKSERPFTCNPVHSVKLPSQVQVVLPLTDAAPVSLRLISNLPPNTHPPHIPPPPSRKVSYPSFRRRSATQWLLTADFPISPESPSLSTFIQKPEMTQLHKHVFLWGVGLFVHICCLLLKPFSFQVIKREYPFTGPPLPLLSNRDDKSIKNSTDEHFIQKK